MLWESQRGPAELGIRSLSPGCPAPLPQLSRPLEQVDFSKVRIPSETLGKPVQGGLASDPYAGSKMRCVTSPLQTLA